MLYNLGQSIFVIMVGTKLHVFILNSTCIGDNKHKTREFCQQEVATDKAQFPPHLAKGL